MSALFQVSMRVQSASDEKYSKGLLQPADGKGMVKTILALGIVALCCLAAQHACESIMASASSHYGAIDRAGAGR